MTDQNPFDVLTNTFLETADQLEKLDLEMNTPAWHFQQNMIKNAQQYRQSKLVDDAYQKGHDEGHQTAIKMFRTILQNAEPTDTVGDIEIALDNELDESSKD